MHSRDFSADLCGSVVWEAPGLGVRSARPALGAVSAAPEGRAAHAFDRTGPLAACGLGWRRSGCASAAAPRANARGSEFGRARPRLVPPRVGLGRAAAPKECAFAGEAEATEDPRGLGFRNAGVPVSCSLRLFRAVVAWWVRCSYPRGLVLWAFAGGRRLLG